MVPLVKSVIADTTPFFTARGYRPVPTLSQFRRALPKGSFQNVIFSGSDYGDEQWLEVNIGVRYALVEKLAFQFTQGLVSFQPHSNTVVCSLGRLRDEPYFRYKVRNAHDQSAAVDDIRTFLIHSGFLWLNQLGELAALDRLLNANPEQPCPFVYNQGHRALRGLVVARLAGRYPFEPLREAYRRFLSKQQPTLLPNFDRLATFLATFSMN